MKPDEHAFLLLVYQLGRNGYMRQDGVFPDEIGRGMGMSIKRIEYLCEKWALKGWFEYGTVAVHGWLTPEGIEYIVKEENGKQEETRG